MALGAQSLFLYGYTVDETNQFLDFQAASGGPVLTATLTPGDYSLTSILNEVVRAMGVADGAHMYTATADRTLVGGTQNRVELAQTGTTANFLSVLFASGPNAGITPAALLGFNPVDYTGASAYFGSQSTGTTLIPQYMGYNYRDDRNQARLFGAVNVSAAGIKEAVVFNKQMFIDVEFKYEANAALDSWVALFDWMIGQKPFDFTPEITNPTRFFQVTLEKTNYDAKGLGWQMPEMLPNFPNLFQTGPLNMRVVLTYQVQTFTFGG